MLGRQLPTFSTDTDDVARNFGRLKRCLLPIITVVSDVGRMDVGFRR